MSDSRASYDDDQLPWLEPVDDEDGPSGLSARKMLVVLVLVLLSAALLAGTFFYLGRKDPVGIGPPELIRAAPGPFKVKPADPGGLDVAGESETAFKTSAGEDTDAQLDLNVVGETTVSRPPAEQPKQIAPGQTKRPLEAQPAPAPVQPSGASGSTIQLGAYKNAAQAERAWTALSTRFPNVAAMTKLVVPFAGGFRLRASATSPANAKEACKALQAAGESCFVAN